MDPRKFLDVAESLIDSVDEEAYIRTSIGRSYYAAYLLGLEKVKSDYRVAYDKLNAPDEHGNYMGSHVIVPKVFLHEDQPTIAGILGGLLRKRRIADYNLSEELKIKREVKKEKAREAILAAREVIKLMDGVT